MNPISTKLHALMAGLLACVTVLCAQPTITSFSPSSGPVGTVVTINGTNLDNISSAKMSTGDLLILSNTSTKLTCLVMPSCYTDQIRLTNTNGNATANQAFKIVYTTEPVNEQSKLVGTGNSNITQEGSSVAISSDGSTVVVGGPGDNNETGAIWIYTRSGNSWTQQGQKLVGTGGVARQLQGCSVAISADGNTVVAGGWQDNNQNGAAWIFVRNNGVWTQQGAKLQANDIIAGSAFGYSVAMSADGNTAMIGALSDVAGSSSFAWVFTRSNGIWTQQGAKLTVTAFSTGNGTLGSHVAVALSADGNTGVIGLSADAPKGAVWVFTRSAGVWTQQGNKLTGTGGSNTAAGQGYSVALSADGNTLLFGANGDNANVGAAWVFSRINNAIWVQQGNRLVGTGYQGPYTYQGNSASLSADGNLAVIGGNADNGGIGAAWYFKRSTNVWSQAGNKFSSANTVGNAGQGSSVALSADGETLVLGGINENANNGAAWIYTTPQLGISVAVTDATCQQNDGSMIITATGGVPPYYYSFYPTTYQRPNNFNGIPAGTYSIIVKDANNTSTYMDVTIGSTCPVINSSVIVDDSCNTRRGSITVSANKGTPPYTFSIDGISFQSSGAFSQLSAGTYHIILDDAQHLRDTLKNIIVKNNCLGTAIVSANASCGGANGSLTATGSGGIPPYTYSIDGTNFQSSGYFGHLSAGNYVITVKDANITTGVAYDTIRNAGGPSSITATTTNAVCDNTGGSITISATGGTAPLQYSIDSVHYQSAAQFTNDTSGAYRIFVKDANGCTLAAGTTVGRYPKPVINLGNDTTLCTGQSILLQAGNNFSSYLWSNGATVSSQTISTAGKYIVTVTDANNCKVNDTIVINIQGPPVFSLGKDTTLCTGQPLNLQVSVSGTYTWSDGSTQNKRTVTTAGLYWAEVSNGGCAFRDTIVVSYIPGPVVKLPNDTTLCNAATLLLDATQQGNNTQYTWQDGVNTSSYLVQSKGTYFVKAVQNNCASSDTINIAYQQTPVQTIARETTKCSNTSIVLDVSFPDAVYRWQDLTTLPVYNVVSQGNYYCTVSNYCGKVTDTMHITDITCECVPNAPNVFSPNGDGVNDEFKPDLGCVPFAYHLKIFNRDGQIVFETSTPTNYWKGDFKGKPVPLGTYYYIITVKAQSDGILREKSGSVTLIR